MRWWWARHKRFVDSQEISDNEGRNKSFIHLPPEFEMLPDYFEPSEKEQGEFMTATDIMNHIQAYTTCRLSPRNIGRALSYWKFERVKNWKLQHYGYWVARLK